MGALLGFLPFLVFAILSVWLGAIIALAVGAAVSAALMIRSLMSGHAPKILEGGTFLLFLAVMLYAIANRRVFSIIEVRLCVDIGLLAIVLLSMAVRRPFTLQYAKEQVAKEYWDTPTFIGTNYAITAGWAVAFFVMVVAEATMFAIPGLPKSFGTAVIVAALFGGAYFTKWRSKAARSTVPPTTSIHA